MHFEETPSVYLKEIAPLICEGVWHIKGAPGETVVTEAW